MAKKYSISEMAESVNQNKENIRRFLKRNDIKEVNADRPYPNSPKYYDLKALELVKAEYKPIEAKKHDSSTIKAQQHHHSSDIEVVQLLKNQIKGLEKDKEVLQDRQKELSQMLSQQQQLHLIAQRRLESLEIEYTEVVEKEDLKEKEPKEETNQSLFSRIFKRNK